MRLYKPKATAKPKHPSPNIRRSHHDEFLLALEKMPSNNGYTDEELSLDTGKGRENARGRRIELVRMGLVKNSGGQRKTGTGRMATVWTLTALGRKAAQRLKGEKHEAV